MSISRRRAAKLTVLAVILVSAFAAAIYYVSPNGSHTRAIAFALGPTSMNAVNSSVYSFAANVNVTFQDGSVWDSVWHPENSNPVSITSTDITQIAILPAPSFGGGLDLKEPYLVALQYAMDWSISTHTAGENPVDLGSLQVLNDTYSLYITANGYQVPQNFSVPELNYTLQVNASGDWNLGPLPHGPWTWQIGTDQIQSIISHATNPLPEADFDLDLTVNVHFQIMTNSGTQSGDATVSWSGQWATLQLQHQDNQLLGFQYSYLDIGLRMMST